MAQIEVRDEQLARVLNAPPVKWEEIAGSMNALALQELSDKLTQQAVYLCRAATYFEQRHGNGCGDQGHASAVKEQNRVAERVRRALGFSYPKQDINF